VFAGHELVDEGRASRRRYEALLERRAREGKRGLSFLLGVGVATTQPSGVRYMSKDKGLTPNPLRVRTDPICLTKRVETMFGLTPYAPN